MRAGFDDPGLAVAPFDDINIKGESYRLKRKTGVINAAVKEKKARLVRGSHPQQTETSPHVLGRSSVCAGLADEPECGGFDN